MTIIRLAEWLAKLEQRRNPISDPRHAAEAREVLLRRVLGLANALARGEPPNNPVVEFDGDIVAALTALYERRRLQ
jgi:hypothetical protein